MEPFIYLPDLAAALPEIPADSIVSRTIVKNDHVDVILFGFAPGQELSEHTSSRPAMLHFLAGEATLTLGDVVETAVAGSWAYMQPKLPHSILAKTQVTMALIMVKGG